MIAERELAALSYPDMPKIVTNDLPGPKARRIIEDATKMQSPTRPSVRGTPPGSRTPMVISSSIFQPALRSRASAATTRASSTRSSASPTGSCTPPGS
jgi:hypothetical protein